MGIPGNEMADGLAKEAARQAMTEEHMKTPHLTKQDIRKELRENSTKSWQNRYDMSMQSLTTHNAIKNVGARRIGNKTYRKGNILLNQVLSGHTRLNCMEIHTNPECETDKCEQCKRPETIDHYLWECCKYEEEREELERETYKSGNILWYPGGNQQRRIREATKSNDGLHPRNKTFLNDWKLITHM